MRATHNRRRFLLRTAAGAVAFGSLLALAAFGRVAAPPIERGLRVFVTGHSFHVPVANPLAEIAKLAGLGEHRNPKPMIVGLPVPSSLKDFAAMDREPLNRLLQAVAWETVLAHPQTGVTEGAK